MKLIAGRYRPVEILGFGGMCVVWRGVDEALGRPVALKVLNDEQAADEDCCEVMREEARAAASLSHPNLVRVYDYGEHRDGDGCRTPYVVMEFVPGPTLAERLEDGPLPWRDAVRVCADIADGLAAMHARGLVHRDVTPTNVILTDAGAKVVDFGIAATIGKDADASPNGAVTGTPAYLAPERIVGDAVTPASDIYAVGLVLYRAIAGTMPWPATTVLGMIQAHRAVEPAPLPSVDDLPAMMHRLCMRCLSKRPAQRPSSRKLAYALRAASQLPPLRNQRQGSTVPQPLPRQTRGGPTSAMSRTVRANELTIAFASGAESQRMPESNR
jgi:serine/threonine-protein kinase